MSDEHEKGTKYTCEVSGCGCLVLLAGVFILLPILFAGTPSLMDGIVHWLMKD